jgi:CHAT domain-containing protein/TolA-binding protein
MTRCLWVGVVVAVLGLLVPAAVFGAPMPTTVSGVRIEQVRSLVMDQASPLRVGDIVLAYRTPARADQPEVRVVVRDALQWRLFELDGLLRAPVTLEILRDETAMELQLADGMSSQLVQSIATPDALDAADQRLLVATAAADWADADAAYDEALKALGSAADVRHRALIALHGARAAMARYDWRLARARLAPALEALPDSLLRVSLLQPDIECTGFLREWRVSQKSLAAAMPTLQREAPHTLLHANFAAKHAQTESFSDPKSALVNVERALVDARTACSRCESLGYVLAGYGDVLWSLSRVVDAGAAYSESVQIAQSVTPRQQVVAHRLVRLAGALRRAGQPELAEPKLREALAILQRLRFSELEFSAVYNALGNVASQQGDLNVARAWYEKSVEISQRLDPEGINGAAAMHNLAQVAITSGDYDYAEQKLIDGLSALERAGNGPNLVLFLTTRAQLEMQRGNDEAAEPILQRVIEIQTVINPDAEIVGIALSELAKLYLRRQQLDASAAATQRAITVFEKLPGDAYAMAEPLAEFGYAQLSLGHVDQAEAYFQRSFELFQKRAPDSLRSTIALYGAGETALARQDYTRAETLLTKVLEIRRRDAPDTARLAQSLHALGRIARVRQLNTQARALFCEAAEVLDRASLRSGGGDLGETRFRAQYAQVYHDCLAAIVDAGDPAAALSVLERSRSRGFRHALEQRRLNFAMPSQQIAMSALDTNMLGYEQALNSANDLSLDAAARSNARARAVRMQAERMGLQSKLVAAVPALSALFQFGKGSIDTASTRLPESTVYVAYSLGEESSVVLSWRKGMPAIAERIGHGRQALAARVRKLRALIGAPSMSMQQYRRESDALYRDLLGPLATHLRGAERLLISADGALHDLPFAALWQAEKRRYLIESHALVFVDSLSSATLAASAIVTSNEKPTLLAVGDPSIGESMQPEIDRRLRSARADAKVLPPLPAARREVQALAKRYPDRTRLLIGDAASEARVRAEAINAGQVHFAVHTLFDPLHPLDSALVLYPGAALNPKDDGLLQVWEIFEGLKLDAELVVLSGCDTAAGKNFAGEGLLGFSRAFAFAGARATIASLWPVEDDSTAELMDHFYTARDASHDEALALQSAMVSMIHLPETPRRSATRRGVGGLAVRDETSGDRRPPYYWAAFQLYGH